MSYRDSDKPNGTLRKEKLMPSVVEVAHQSFACQCLLQRTDKIVNRKTQPQPTELFVVIFIYADISDRDRDNR